MSFSGLSCDYSILEGRYTGSYDHHVINVIVDYASLGLNLTLKKISHILLNCSASLNLKKIHLTLIGLIPQKKHQDSPLHPSKKGVI